MAKKPIFHETQDFTSYVSGRCEERSRLSVSDSPPGKYFRLRLSFDWSKSGTREKISNRDFFNALKKTLLYSEAFLCEQVEQKSINFSNERANFFQSSFPRRDQEKVIFCQTVISDFDWSVQLAWMSSVRWQHEMNSSKWLLITETSIMG